MKARLTKQRMTRTEGWVPAEFRGTDGILAWWYQLEGHPSWEGPFETSSLAAMAAKDAGAKMVLMTLSVRCGDHKGCEVWPSEGWDMPEHQAWTEEEVSEAADEFVDAMSAKCRTNSEIFVLTLLCRVRHGEVDPFTLDIAVRHKGLWHKMPVTEDGDFDCPWPGGFFAFRRTLLFG